MTQTRTRTTSALYSALIGIVSVLVLLQALWAGLFVHEGQDYKESWVEIHARGADAAIVLAAIATVVALWRLRARRDLWIPTAVLTVALVLETYLGGLIGQTPAVTVVHFPLAMAIMALVVWLPFRSRVAR